MGFEPDCFLWDLVTVILANLLRFVQHSTLAFCALLVLCFCPALAQEASQELPQAAEPEYVSGRVIEIESETQVQDEAFGREEKKYRFKVHFPAHAGNPEETIVLEQSYSPDTPGELLPRKGKHFIFYKETLADGSHAYTLIDVQRLNHIPWVALLVAILLVLLGRWYGIKALAISAALLFGFLLMHLLHLPWVLSSLLTCAAVIA